MFERTYGDVLQRIVEFLLRSCHNHDICPFLSEEFSKASSHTLRAASNYHRLILFVSCEGRVLVSVSRTLPSTSNWFFREKMPMISSERMAINAQTEATAQ